MATPPTEAAMATAETTMAPVAVQVAVLTRMQARAARALVEPLTARWRRLVVTSQD
jgi:hypothetical protein